MESKNRTKKGFLKWFDLPTAEIKQMADVKSQFFYLTETEFHSFYPSQLAHCLKRRPFENTVLSALRWPSFEAVIANSCSLLTYK
ncbi:hypothetical protein CRE_11363 [Caenorhabditis remanei]|uniref:Uncharacterized protein n=1 Tax=Caenorhabditis remanei TaxID=31234 RepID=E3N0J7_CAERE|nr:hypothetical protein CRE_11363 [Caenorhabditis remanei]